MLSKNNSQGFFLVEFTSSPYNTQEGQSFFKLLSKVSLTYESQVQNIDEASPLTPSDGVGFSVAISIYENLAFCVNHSPENECEIFLKSNS